MFARYIKCPFPLCFPSVASGVLLVPLLGLPANVCFPGWLVFLFAHTPPASGLVKVFPVGQLAANGHLRIALIPIFCILLTSSLDRLHTCQAEFIPVPNRLTTQVMHKTSQSISTLTDTSPVIHGEQGWSPLLGDSIPKKVISEHDCQKTVESWQKIPAGRTTKRTALDSHPYYTNSGLLRWKLPNSKPIKESTMFENDGKNRACFDIADPLKISALLHTDARIYCTVQNIDFGSTVMSWWKENGLRELTIGTEVSGPKYGIDRKRPNSWTLIIRNVTSEDAGNYICQINLLKVKEKFFTLTVIKPNMTKRPLKLNDQYVRDDATTSSEMQQKQITITGSPEGQVGHAHVLTCLARYSHPGPTSGLQWSHDSSTTLSAAESRDHRKTENWRKVEDTATSPVLYNVSKRWISQSTLLSVLTIYRLTKQAGGVWRCTKYSRDYMESPEQAAFRLAVVDGRPIGLKQPRLVSDKNYGNNLYPCESTNSLVLLQIALSFFIVNFHIL